MAETQEGLVIARAPGYFIVRTDDGATHLCVLRGKLRRARSLSLRPTIPSRGRPQATVSPTIEPNEEAPVIVAVGDRVRITSDGASGGAIESILPRRNKLARAAVESIEEQILLANLDQVVLVFAVRDPVPHLGLLDRYLVLAEDAEIPAVICFTKIDLGISEEVEEAVERYSAIGYPVIQTSIVSSVGLDAMHELLGGRVTLLTGPSGVGKSSLLNVLEPAAGQRIGEISIATGKGKHTTTGVRLFPLSNGGWLADSAGIRELAPWRLDRERLAAAFKEFRPYIDQCAFDDCTHDELADGCAVRAALDDGLIAESRYESYLRLLSDIPES